MNKINFNQTGGFPFETNTLDEMQKAYEIFNNLGALAGNKAIIKGCKQTGNIVDDGYIYLDGEVLQFQGGQIQPNIIVVEDVTDMIFQDGTQKPVYKHRYATFGTGANAIPWADFKRVFPFTSGLFLDEVRMFAGDINNIPEGWYLCNGQNGTVDLRSRFIVGLNPNDSDYDQVGKTGGEKEVALTISEIPAHNHTAVIHSGGGHQHTYQYYRKASKGKARDDAYWRVEGGLSTGTTSYTGSHTHSISINPTGNGDAHENRPPYYTLAFIQFKGI